MKGSRQKRRLSQATEGWPCPRCGAPLAVTLLTLWCHKCHFLHPKLLTVDEAAEILGVSVKEVGNLIERSDLRVRVQRDSIGRVRRRFLDVLDLWRYQADTGSI